MWSDIMVSTLARDLRAPLGDELRRGRHVTADITTPQSRQLALTISTEDHGTVGSGSAPMLTIRSDERIGGKPWADTESGSHVALSLRMLGFERAVHTLVAILADLTNGPGDITFRGLTDHRPLPQLVTANAGPYRITVCLSGGLSYAMAHNRVSPVREFVLEATDPGLHEDLEIAVSIDSQLDPQPSTTITSSTTSPDSDSALSLSIPLRLDPAVMSTVDEAVAADLVIELVGSTSGIHTIRHPLNLLAYNEWANLGQFPETLASFVQPNHPAIRQVLKRASEILLGWTNSSSLEGYQSGSQRAQKIAAAIYEALRELQITYINPPASFESYQRVRMPDEVIDDGFGTCLDTTVVYAACLEQAGLHPVLFMIYGHAFAGFLSAESRLPETVVTDVNTMINLVESRAVIPVETTTLASGDMSQAFTKAVDQAKRTVTSRPQELRSLIDVRATRATVRPLPHRGHTPVRDEPVITDAPAPEPTVMPTPPPPTERQKPAEPVRAGGVAASDSSPARIKMWKTALLDLSFRNPLLNFKDRAGDVRLILPAGGLHRFEDAIATGYKHTLYANDKLTDLQREQGLRGAQQMVAEDLSAMLFDNRVVFTSVPTDSFDKALRSLRRKARALEEETGANHLFLTMGELRWTDDGKPEGQSAAKQRTLRSPLILLPMRLDGGVKGKPTFSFHIEEGGLAVPNYSLLEKLRASFGLEIPELMTPLTDDAGVDIDAVLAAVRTALVSAGLPFRVEESGYLALLSFTSFRLWKDLDEFQETFLSTPVVRHLVHSANEPFIDPAGTSALRVNETELMCPVPADGSQMQAVAWAAQGRSFVLEGPPGTGKSQTITNLIAHLMTLGKRVLFVAEKQPALEVVQRRLAAVGLGSLTLNLHGKSQTPAQVRAAIKDALNLSAESSDALWEATLSRVKAAVSKLAAYPEALHQKNAIGMSVWDAHQSLLAAGPGPVADLNPRFVTDHPEQVAAVQGSLADLPTAMAAAGDIDSHPWRSSRLASPDDLVPADVDSSLSRLETALNRAATQAASLAHMWQAATNVDTLHKVAELAPSVARGVAPTSTQLQVTAIPGWTHALQGWATAVDEFAARESETRRRYDPRVMTLDLEGLQAKATEAATKFLGKKRHQKVLIEQLRPFLQVDTEPDREDLVSDLSALIADRNEGRALQNQVREVHSLTLPADWSVWDPNAGHEIRASIDALQLAADLTQLMPQTPQLLDQLAASGARSNMETGAALEDLVAAWSGVVELIDLDPGQFGEAQPLVPQIVATLPAWQHDGQQGYLALRRWARLEEVLAPLRETGLERFVEELMSGEISPDEASVAFSRGLAERCIEERLAITGLDHFDAVTHDRITRKYVSEADSLREQMASMLPARHLARTDDLRATPEFGALSREVGKTRSRTTIRTLMERHGADIQQTIPCFLMSPDSVARLLSPKDIHFDVVVFDEASQIKVAEAIGALGRASSAIVVGDSRQMPPSSVAQIASSDDEDLVESTVVPKDEESILSEAIEAGLPQLWLSWHYRSQDESLIAFSNHNYYDGRLSSFPTPRTSDPNSGVHLRQVDGLYARGKERTNEIEAKAIVDEVIRRLNDPVTQGQSIGVVTFNQQQQTLIAEMLETCGDDAVAAAMSEDKGADRLFVKNLESVQGDERDVILFSLAFSIDPTTGKLPLNFGPLNQTGGERRLNVAITRARRLVMLFASFRPQDMDLKSSSSVGLAHLKAYLELAQANTMGEALKGKEAITGRDLHREQVAAALAERGLRVQTGLGLSDFTVDIAVANEDDEEWRVAVLLDGPGWARRTTVADRDGFPLSVLGGPMGWQSVERVWLPAWRQEPQQILDRIEELVRREPNLLDAAASGFPADDPASPEYEETDLTGEVLEGAPLPEEPPVWAAPEADEIREPASSTSATPQAGDAEVAPTARPSETWAPPVASAAAPVDMPQPVPQVGSLVERVPFRPASTEQIAGTWVLDSLSDPQSRERVTQALESAIGEEGPIELNRLVRIVGRRFGVQRMRAARAEAVGTLIDPDMVVVSPMGSFVWPVHLDPAAWPLLRYQASPTERPIAEIPPEELLNAARWVLRTGGAMDSTSLLRGMLGEFGQIRLTGPSEQRLRQALDDGVELGILRNEWDDYELV